MEKIIALALNQFRDVPTSLQQRPDSKTPRTEITVNLASLYHHYYLDSHGRTPPNPDPVQFEHLQFLVPTEEFRLRGDGIGIAPGIRRHRSTELGQAFCRMFLHDHLKIAYFAHLHDLLDREAWAGFSPVRVERLESGDTPDYLCAESVDRVFLSEAKGRYTAISFANREFDSWRRQFKRVVVKNSAGQPCKVKGYIVATRFATELKPSLKSGIFAEDPESPGVETLGEEARALGTVAMALHYGGIAEKLDQPVLAAALLNRFVVPEQIQFPATVWQLQLGPLSNTKFVGGYFSSPSGLPPFQIIEGKLVPQHDLLRLDVARTTFFGVEESIFRDVVALVRGGDLPGVQVRHFDRIEPFYSAISVLRDGSILGPVEFFRPLAQVVF